MQQYGMYKHEHLRQYLLCTEVYGLSPYPLSTLHISSLTVVWVGVAPSPETPQQPWQRCPLRWQITASEPSASGVVRPFSHHPLPPLCEPISSAHVCTLHYCERTLQWPPLAGIAYRG